MKEKILNKKSCLDYLNHRSKASKIKGNFLCFLQIGIIERFGQWRYAGKATNLDESFHKIEDLQKELVNQYNIINDSAYEHSKEWLIELAEGMKYLTKQEIKNLGFSSKSKKKKLNEVENISFCLENRGIGPANVIVIAEGEAPYDDCGFAILEVTNLNGHPYENRPAESVAPLAAWSGGDWELDWEINKPDDYLPKK